MRNCTAAQSDDRNMCSNKSKWMFWKANERNEKKSFLGLFGKEKERFFMTPSGRLFFFLSFLRWRFKCVPSCVVPKHRQYATYLRIIFIVWKGKKSEGLRDYQGNVPLNIRRCQRRLRMQSYFNKPKAIAPATFLTCLHFASLSSRSDSRVMAS